MSTPKQHYIPHLLCQSDPKVSRVDLEKIDDYVRECGNPRWAASHLVRAIARGLDKEDRKTADALYDIANTLSSSHPVEEPKDIEDMPDLDTYLWS